MTHQVRLYVLDLMAVDMFLIEIADGNVQVLEPKNFKDLGSKRVKIRYGPMVVPGIDDESTHGMQSFDGMNAAMPCQDCLITAALPNLEFEDGTTANANTSMSLHHTVLFNLNRTDATCETFPERFLAAGNERTPLDLTLGGYVNQVNSCVFRLLINERTAVPGKWATT